MSSSGLGIVVLSRLSRKTSPSGLFPVNFACSAASWSHAVRIVSTYGPTRSPVIMENHKPGIYPTKLGGVSIRLTADSKGVPATSTHAVCRGRLAYY